MKNPTLLALSQRDIEILGSSLELSYKNGLDAEVQHRKTFGSGIITADTAQERAYMDMARQDLLSLARKLKTQAGYKFSEFSHLGRDFPDLKA